MNCLDDVRRGDFLQHLSPSCKDLNTTPLPLNLPNPRIQNGNQCNWNNRARLGNRIASGLNTLLRSSSWLLGYHHTCDMQQYAATRHGHFHLKHHHGSTYLGTPNWKSLAPTDV